MAWANEEIAGLLREYAELTQITGGDVFRARNYGRAGPGRVRPVRGLGALGVGTAQRGWLTPDDVINTWPLDTLRAFLRKGR
jgi:hypothetical protein